MDALASSTSIRRLVLIAVAALLTGAATLAIAILLFGDFSDTEGRILGTTAILAGYSLLALPAAILRDRRRLPALAAVVLTLTAAGASLGVAGIWVEEPGDAFGKALGTVNAWMVASVQIATLALRRSHRDPYSVRWLYAASSGLVILLATMLTVVLWADIDSEMFGRVFGALVVLDVLLVALQPVLARIRPAGEAHRLRVVVAPNEILDMTVEAVDVATAATKAISTLERDGRQVLDISFVDRKRDAGAPSVRDGLAATPEAASRDRSPLL